MGFAQIQLINGPDIVRPTIELTISTVQDFELAIKNEDGLPINLTDYDAVDHGPPVRQACQPGATLPITTGVQFVASEYQGQVLPSVSVTCTITNAVGGLVDVSFGACDFTKPGVYLAEIEMIKDGVLEQVFRMYVDAQASLAYAINGPLTIAEVRLWARDSIPEDNFLLDEVEFKDAEVVAAIRRAVDVWNTTTPVLGKYTYTASDFPFRSQWLDLTLSLLYGIAARSYLRNHLPYQAAGIQIDDKDKFEPYYKLSQDAKAEFVQWAKETKLQLNAQQCWGRSSILFTGCGGRAYTYGNYFSH